MPSWKRQLSWDDQLELLYRAVELRKTNVPLAIKTLAEIPGMPGGHGLLIDILDVFSKINDKDTEVRYDGVTRLGDRAADGKVTWHPIVIMAHCSLLHKDPDYFVRSGAAWSLGFMFDSQYKGRYPEEMLAGVTGSLFQAVRQDRSFRKATPSSFS